MTAALIYSVTESGVGHFIALTGTRTECGVSAAYAPSFIATFGYSDWQAFAPTACPECVAAMRRYEVDLAEHLARVAAAAAHTDTEEIWD